MGRMKDLLITIYGGGAAAVEAAKMLTPEWIPVSEETLPANQGFYLVAGRDNGVMIVREAHYSPDHDFWFYNEDGIIADYWQPLPEPPES